MADTPQGNNSNPPSQSGGGNNNRRRRHRGNGNASRGPNPNNPQGQGNQQTQGPRQNQGQGPGPRPPQGGNQGQSRPHGQSSGQNRSRRGPGRVLTSSQVLVKYDNLLEQHLITRRKYYEYFNRVDERQLYRLEKNFFDSIEHLRRFEAGLEPWQREALEKRKTERYRLDLTYSNNRGWNPEEIAKADFAPDEKEDPHFKESQKEAFAEYAEDTEESEGTFEDYLKLKGEA